MDISNTVFSMAKERTGALMVFQRREALDAYLLHGIKLDSLPSSQLLLSIFKDGTPLHDGAVVIQDGRIALASCYLPLSHSSELPQHFGTRHRAGLGLAERSDAVVIIVSEEKGTVSLALGRNIQAINSPEELCDALQSLLNPVVQEANTTTFKRRIFTNLWPKVTILLFVFLCWVLITSREGTIITVNAPVKFHNLPGDLALTKTTPDEIEVQLKVFSNLVPPPKQMDIVADIPLSRAKEGVNSIAIRNEDIKSPPGAVITGLSRSTIKIATDKKIVRQMIIKVETVSKLPGNLRLRFIRVEPPTVAVEGAAHLVSQFDQVQTEEIDLSEIDENTAVERKVLSPSPQLKILNDKPVKISIYTERAH